VSIKSAYVSAARAARSGLSAAGVLPAFDRWSAHSRTGTWARSLLSIYDVEELAALDVPWWTFDSAGLIDAFLAGRRGACVFEWGSGASTVWLARRSERVVTVEHDVAWADVVRGLLPAGHAVDLQTVPAAPAVGSPGDVLSAKAGSEGLDFSAYVAAIDERGEFDLIVIDGRAREACLASALPHLARDGMIVVDNVERRRYRDAIAAAAEVADLDVIWTRGLTPGLPYPTRTALLRRSR